MTVARLALAAICTPALAVSALAHHSHNNYAIAEFTHLEGIVKEVHLRDGSNGCLLGFLTPMHGDAARGPGIEKEWDD